MHYMPLVGTEQQTLLPSNGSIVLPLLCVFKVKVMLQPMVSHPVCFGMKNPSGTQALICVIVRQLRVC
jgi:hypothetical protein